MNIIRRLINKTNEIIVIQGVELQPNVYYDIPENELHNYVIDEFLFTKIVNREIYVNNGYEDIEDITKALKWLIGNQVPPSSTEGYWKNVSVDYSDLSENEKFNISFDVILNSNGVFSEVINLKQNKNFCIYNVNFYSTNIHALLLVEYYRKIGGEDYRINPFIKDIDYLYDFVVNGDFPENSSTIDILPNNFKTNINFVPNSVYCFKINNNVYYEKIENYNKETNKITFKNSIPFVLNNGLKIGNVDKPIFSVFSMKSNENLNFKASLNIRGNGNDFIKINIINLCKKDFTQCGLVLNGYYEK